MKIFGGVILIMLLCVPACFAELSLYLYPRIACNKGFVMMSDIAKIETDAQSAERIKSISIDGSFFSDGYLDRREILDILKNSVTGPINIYGTGVRVVKAEADEAVRDSRMAVQKGAMVRFQVVNGGIRVEMTGTAMGDGAVGDEIPVKLKGSTVSRGRIVNERVVELAL